MRYLWTRSLARLIPVALLLLGTSSCTTVTETGRRQIILISPSEEMQLGLSDFQKMKQETRIYPDPQWTAALQRVGKRISAVATLPNAQWEFVLFDSPEANAFCLPGGKVGVYKGILPIVKNEAGLATVIGHEVAHAAARHGAERVTQGLLLQAGGDLLQASLSKSEAKTRQVASTVYGLGSQVGIALPHSRKQESEADQIGLLYMARAGYQPAEAVQFWQRFAAFNQQNGSATPWFLRTHPMDEVRIKDLQAQLPKAQAEYRPAQ